MAKAKKAAAKAAGIDLKEVLRIALLVAVRFVPPPFNFFLSLLLEQLLKQFRAIKAAAGDAPTAFAAPDELKTWLTNFLLAAVEKIDRPFLRLALRSLVANLTGAVVDEIWDRLLQLGVIQGQPAATFARTPEAAAAAPTDVQAPTPEELTAAVEEELSQAA